MSWILKPVFSFKFWVWSQNENVLLFKTPICFCCFFYFLPIGQKHLFEYSYN